ncbi:hypothetical protein BOX15_Mlig020982g1, partial [Macrostomum lignano]
LQSSCKMAHGADSPPSRPLGLTSASSTSAALPSPQPPYLTSTPPLLLAPAASADSNGWCRSATEPPCNTPAVTPTSAIVRLPPPPPPAPPPPPLPPPGRSALRSSIGGGPRVLRKRVTIRETLLDDSASGSNSGSYSACRLVEIRRLSLTEPQPAHRMAPPGSSGADAADSAASSSSKEAPPRLMVDSKDDNDGDPTTSTAVPTTGVVVVVAPQADESCPELPAAPSVSPAGVAEPPVLVVNGDISLATTAMPTLPPPAAAAAAAIRTFASASTSPSPSSPAVSATTISVGSIVGAVVASSSEEASSTAAAQSQVQQQPQQQQQPPSPHVKLSRQSSTNSSQQQQSHHSRSREEKQKERQRRREAQMWRRHQMELQLKQRGIAVSPCGRWIKHNLKCGEGAYKRVYRGYDREQGRPIAWCELKYQVGKDKPAERDQVRKEVEMMIKCEHPNIVRYYDLLDCYFELDENGERGEKVKATVIVTEFMSEGTLKEKMKTFYNEQTREAVVEFSVFQSWMQQILEGLRHMHHKMNPPVIHRDLKPENVFIADGENPDEYYNIKIGDFGLATAKTQSRKTMLGTLGYMAPEMLQERYDEKVDIFAFGLLMVELVTNCVPYQECQNFMDVWQRIASTTPPQVLNRLENPEIRDIFFTCTHPLPDFRPTSEELLSLQIFNLKPIPVQVQLVRLSQTVRWQDEDTVSPTQPTVAAAQQQISGTSSTARHRALSADVEYVGDPGRYYHVADFRLVVNDRALQQQMRILPGVGFEFQLDCFIDEDLENVVNSFADLAESDAPGLSADQLRRLRQKVVNSVRNQLLYYRKKVLAGIWNYFMDLIRDSEPEKDSELDTCIVRLGLQARRWAEAKRRVIKERDDYNGRWEEEAGGGGSGGQGQASPATAPSSAAVSRQVSQVDSQSQQQQQLADCLCEQPLNESPKAPADQNFGYFGVPGSPGYQPQVESLPAAMSASMSAIMNGQHHGNGLQYDFLASNSFISSSSVNATVTATVTSSLVAPVSADLPSSPLLLSLDAGEAALSAPVSPAVRCRKESSGASQQRRRAESPAPPTTPTAAHPLSQQRLMQHWTTMSSGSAQLLLPGLPPQPLPGLEAGRCLLLCPSASGTQAPATTVTCLAFDGGPQMRLEDVLAVLSAVQASASAATATNGAECGDVQRAETDQGAPGTPTGLGGTGAAAVRPTRLTRVPPSTDS